MSKSSDSAALVEQCRSLLASSTPPPAHVVRAVSELLSSGAPPPANTAGRLVLSGEDSSAGAPGTSLQLGQQPDAKLERYLQRHAAREHRLPPDLRGQKIREFQALMEGEGGKYVHADHRPEGGTQIGNMVSPTPSMYDDFESPSMFKGSSTILGRGAPPIRKSVSSNRAFRVA